jgi:PAS domain-containing protein
MVGAFDLLPVDRALRATRRTLLVSVDMEALNYQERFRPADALTLHSSPLLIDLDDARPLAQAIVDTIRDPLMVLDQDLRVVTANRAFCQAFRRISRTFMAARFTGWAMANGISPSFGCCWKAWHLSTP